MRNRIPFLGLDARPLEDESPDGLCDAMNNMRPDGPEDSPHWIPFKKYGSNITVDATIPEIPTIACEAVAESGGAGVTETELPLSPSGGFFAFDCEAFGVTDKFEILHNGVKVATSGMTVPNEGPFDSTDLSSADQFIGSSKGSIPNRQATCQSETGTSITSTKQQLIWWVYDAADYAASATCTVRVTGPGGTAWNFTRKCS